jgi:hypothetical protein
MVVIITFMALCAGKILGVNRKIFLQFSMTAFGYTGGGSVGLAGKQADEEQQQEVCDKRYSVNGLPVADFCFHFDLRPSIFNIHNFILRSIACSHHGHHDN